MSEEQNVICIIPVDEAKRRGIPYPVQPYMVHHNCERCDELCWIGPRGLGIKATNSDTPILCANCVMGDVALSGIPPVIHSLGGK
jgi:hypothetical protein